MSNIMENLHAIQDKWQALLTVTLFNLVIALASLICSLIILSKWGFMLGFQCVTSSIAFILYCSVLYAMLRNERFVTPKFWAGIWSCVTLMLLQNYLLWGGLSGHALMLLPSDGDIDSVFRRVSEGQDGEETGGDTNVNAKGRFIVAGGAERAMSAFAFLCFISNIGLHFLIWIWRREVGLTLDDDAFPYDEGYGGNVNSSRPQGSSIGDTGFGTSPSRGGSNDDQWPGVTRAGSRISPSESGRLNASAAGDSGGGTSKSRTNINSSRGATVDPEHPSLEDDNL